MNWSLLRKMVNNMPLRAAVSRTFAAPKQPRASMRGSFYVLAGAIAGSLALSLGVPPSVASASTTVGLNLTDEGTYWCPVSCATSTTFSAFAIAHSGSQSFGVVTVSIAGTVLSVNPDGCAVQSEKWVPVVPKGRSTILASTTSDTICPTANPNILLETGTLTIAGGTGPFRDASGGASFMFAVLVQPQVAGGAITGTITY
jgi:hypothetical protein